MAASTFNYQEKQSKLNGELCLSHRLNLETVRTKARRKKKGLSHHNYQPTYALSKSLSFIRSFSSSSQLHKQSHTSDNNILQKTFCLIIISATKRKSKGCAFFFFHH